MDARQNIDGRSARYTFRLRVSSTAQQALLAEWGRCRWVWNECVARSRKAHRDGEKCGPAALDKMLTDARPEFVAAGRLVRSAAAERPRLR